jgi:hypothetical protein
VAATGLKDGFGTLAQRSAKRKRRSTCERRLGPVASCGTRNAAVTEGESKAKIEERLELTDKAVAQQGRFALNYACRLEQIAYASFPEAFMEWVTPQHEEVDLNCEISSYANAEL